MSGKSRGFTLIELLVVIAIIAILAAILFPVFARARAKAEANTCLSNVKQLTLGVMMYISDYDQCFPFSLAGWAYGPTWKGCIYPYVKNADLFQCPSYFPRAVSEMSNDFIPGTTVRFPRSYALHHRGPNQYCGTGIGGIPGVLNYQSVYMGEIANPAETLVISESPADWSPNFGLACPPGTPAQLVANHSKQANWGFCDGHVKSLRPTATNLTQNMWTIEDDGPCTTQRLPCFLAVTEQNAP